MNLNPDAVQKGSCERLKEIRAIFFDAGGTLIHLDSSYICNTLRQQIGVELAEPEFRRAQFLAMSRVAELVAEGVGSTEQLKRQFYSTLLPQLGVREGNLNEAVECALELAQREMLWRTADQSVPNALEELKSMGFSLAVVSNSDGRIQSALEHAGLAKYLDFSIDSFHVGIEKPDPRIFSMAASRAGVAPQQAAYVGDLYEVDVIGSRNAGLLPILFDPFETNKNQDCLTVRTLSELPSLFQ